MTARPLPATPLRRSTDSRGKTVHNLVMAYDSGNPCPEFRVQCEVLLSFDEAKAVMIDLANASRGTAEERLASLKHARDIVIPRIDGRATDAFRESVRRGFDDNIAHLEEITAQLIPDGPKSGTLVGK
jgi:hypothetical protein